MSVGSTKRVRKPVPGELVLVGVQPVQSHGFMQAQTLLENCYRSSLLMKKWRRKAILPPTSHVFDSSPILDSLKAGKSQTESGNGC